MEENQKITVKMFQNNAMYVEFDYITHSVLDFISVEEIEEMTRKIAPSFKYKIIESSERKYIYFSRAFSHHHPDLYFLKFVCNKEQIKEKVRENLEVYITSLRGGNYSKMIDGDVDKDVMLYINRSMLDDSAMFDIVREVNGCCGASYLNCSFYSKRTHSVIMKALFNINTGYIENVLDDKERYDLGKYLYYFIIGCAADLAYNSHGTSMMIATDSEKEPKYEEIVEAIGGKVETGIINRKTEAELNLYHFKTKDLLQFCLSKVREYKENPLFQKL